MKNYLIAALAVSVILLALFGKGCNQAIDLAKEQLTTKQEAIYDTITVLKDSIIYQEKEVIKWKTKKAGITYVTKFDTLATFDTVYVELVKCDSTNNINSNIIASLDTANAKLHKVVEIQDDRDSLRVEEIKIANKDAGRRERKGFGIGFVAGFIVGLLIP